MRLRLRNPLYLKPIPTPPLPTVRFVIAGTVYGRQDGDEHSGVQRAEREATAWRSEIQMGGWDGYEYRPIKPTVVSNGDWRRLVGVQRPIVRIVGEPSEDIMQALLRIDARVDKVMHT
jgi:hypothetical protein